MCDEAGRILQIVKIIKKMERISRREINRIEIQAIIEAEKAGGCDFELDGIRYSFK